MRTGNFILLGQDGTPLDRETLIGMFPNLKDIINEVS